MKGAMRLSRCTLADLTRNNLARRSRPRHRTSDSRAAWHTAAPLAPQHSSVPMPTDAAPRVAIVGAGPAGLMAAQVLAEAGVPADLFDSTPSAGRKFLLAGKGGLNLTHSEPLDAFKRRFRAHESDLAPLLDVYGPEQVRAWARGLGIDTFVGSSGRIFPHDLKAAPLLRAWLHRLRGAGVRMHMRHRCLRLTAAPDDGWNLTLRTPLGDAPRHATAVVLALGGASWPQLGSDGAWVEWLRGAGADVTPLAPSNCGFDVCLRHPNGSVQPGWSEHLRDRFAGAALKTVALTWSEPAGSRTQRGEFVVTRSGVEGSLVYAASAALREQIAAHGEAAVHVDLLPDRSVTWVREELARPRGPRSFSTHLKTRLRIDGVKAALLRERVPPAAFADACALAEAIKALPLLLCATRPIAEAISSAGGVRFEALTPSLMLKALPGVFCAGEMLDWEAPTGGYLLTACLATGAAAGRGVLAYVGPSKGCGAGLPAV